LPGLLILLLISAALVVARLAAEPAAALRYVAPAGSDGGGNLCLDPVAPCATVGRALAVAQSGDTIQLAAGEYVAAGLNVNTSVAIRGEGAAKTTIDGQGRDTLLIVSGGTLTLEGLTLRGGAGLIGGAARVAAGGALTLRRVTLEANSADQGGAIYAAGTGVIVEDTILSGNTAGVGGAIYIAGGPLTMTRTEILGNSAGAGGGLFIGPAGTADLRAVTFSGNQADTVGGGIFIQNGALLLANGVLQENVAGARGGGLFNDGGKAEIDYSTAIANSAPAGAAIAAPPAATGQTWVAYSVLSGPALCAGPVTGQSILADDDSCGLAAKPATNLDADGRPTYNSNAIDAGPISLCATRGATLTTDRRGEPRPAGSDGATRCDLGAYEFQPRLTIRHVPNLIDGTRFNFGGDLGNFVLSAAGQSRAVFEAAPGALQVNQQQEPGWKLTAITCSGDVDGGSAANVAGRAITIDLDPGEAISCVFTSRPNRDTIGVSVSGPAGEDPAVAFSGGLGAFELRPITQSDRHSGKAAPGVYLVQAAPPAGWRVAAIACSGDRDAGTTVDPAAGLALVDLDAKEAIGCAFALTPDGATTLTIDHKVTPLGAAAGLSFVYSGDLGAFALRAGDSPRSFSPPPGAYRLHELLHPTWALSRLECAGDLDGGSVLLPEEATAFIDLDEGEAIHCIFDHVPATSGMGTILIENAPQPADGTPFAYAGALGDFTLWSPDISTRTFAQLKPGSYAVRQVTPAGWMLSEIACQGDSDAGTVLLLDEATARIDLDEDEVIRCVFSATHPLQTGAITIIHEPTPADGTQFRYNGALGGFTLRAPSRPSQIFIDLAAGAYLVNSRPQDGWTLLGISCDGDNDGGTTYDLPNRRMTLDLDAGEAIVCRFTHAGAGVTVTPTLSPTPSPTVTPSPGGTHKRVYIPIIR
jgi:predicted outer membrane repeat protein